MNEDFDILKEKATKRGEREKHIIALIASIVVILIVASPFFVFFHGFDIMADIIQTKLRDNKIYSIISKGNYDVKASLIKVKVMSQWCSRSRYGRSTYWTKYKNLENNEFFILDNDDLRL